MTPARKTHTATVTQLDEAAQLRQAVADAVAGGVRTKEITEAINLLRRVKAGEIASMIAMPNHKDRNALFIKGCKYVGSKS